MEEWNNGIIEQWNWNNRTMEPRIMEQWNNGTGTKEQWNN